MPNVIDYSGAIKADENAEQLTCGYICEDGHACGEVVEEGEYCKWHDSDQVLTDPAIRLNLQARAKEKGTMHGYQLGHADLHDVDLVNHGQQFGYKLVHSDLYRADLRGAHLFRLDLSNSSLMKANLKGANMHSVNLTNANLLGTIFDKASLDGVVWGDRVLQEAQAAEESDPVQKKFLYHEAEEVYRNLRIAHDSQGHGLRAGRFFRREMVMRRMQMPKYSFQRLLSKLIDMFSGYGEQPLRVILFSVTAILVFAVLYSLLGVRVDGELISMSLNEGFIFNSLRFLESLYFSVVTFTTLGYGDVTPVGVTRLVAATEAFIGAFTLAMFVVMVVKKTTR